MEVYSHALPLYPCLTKRAALSVSDLYDAKTMLLAASASTLFSAWVHMLELKDSA